MLGDLNVPAKLKNQNRFKSTVFHALSDPIRLEILSYLRDGEKCVCEIVPRLDLIQPLVSRHLKILRERRMVQSERHGTVVIYSLADRRIIEALDLLRAAMRDMLAQRAALVEMLE